jgi:hypothetical protein
MERFNYGCLWLFAALFLILPGCQKAEEFQRVSIEGVVTYKGAPVPFGAIWFEPEANLGPSAPTGFAVIQSGKFKTKPSDSPIAGSHSLRITGFKEHFDVNNAASLERREFLFPEFVIQREISENESPWTIEAPAPE